MQKFELNKIIDCDQMRPNLQKKIINKSRKIQKRVNKSKINNKMVQKTKCLEKTKNKKNLQKQIF